MAIKLVASPKNAEGDLRRETTAPGFRVELVRLVGKRDIQFEHQGAAFIGLCNILRTDGETLAGEKRSVIKDIRGRLTFVPPKVKLEGWARYPSRRSSYLTVYFDPSKGDFGPCDVTTLPPTLHFQDQRITATLIKFKEALIGGESDDVAYMESIGILLLHELCKSPLATKSQRNSGGLTPVQIARIRDYVSSHIASPITITELSLLIGVSRFHLIRAFRDTVGIPPYQYVLGERVNAAKLLLRNSDAKIDHVARAVGFSDPLQLGRAFRKFTGLTPSEFRRLRND